MSVLAHQGGWDEILFVLAPLVLFAILLWIARKRVDDLESENADEDENVQRTGSSEPADDHTPHP